MVSKVAVLVLLGSLLVSCKGDTGSSEETEGAVAPAESDFTVDDETLLQVETFLIDYLRAEAGRKQELRPQLENWLPTIVGAGMRPRDVHFALFDVFAHRELGLEPRSMTDWERGVYDYVFLEQDPAVFLEELRTERVDRVFSPAASRQIAHGLFRDDRGARLREIAGAHVDLGSLVGKTIADIGGGPGQMSVHMHGDVGPSGKVIIVDIDDTVRQLGQHMADYDPRFRPIEFRILDEGVAGTECGLSVDEVDSVFLMDTHILGGAPSDPDIEARINGEQSRWVECVRRSLRQGGEILIFETTGRDGLGADGASPEQVVGILKSNGFTARAVKAEDYYVVIAHTVDP